MISSPRIELLGLDRLVNDSLTRAVIPGSLVAGEIRNDYNEQLDDDGRAYRAPPR